MTKTEKEQSRKILLERIVICAIAGLCSKHGIVGDDPGDYYTKHDVANFAIELAEEVIKQLENK